MGLRGGEGEKLKPCEKYWTKKKNKALRFDNQWRVVFLVILFRFGLFKRGK